MYYSEQYKPVSDNIAVRMVGGHSYGIDIKIGAFIVDVTVGRQLYNYSTPGSIKVLTSSYLDVTEEFVKKEKGVSIPPTSENLYKILTMVRNTQIAQNPKEENDE